VEEVEGLTNQFGVCHPIAHEAPALSETHRGLRRLIFQLSVARCGICASAVVFSKAHQRWVTNLSELSWNSKNIPTNVNAPELKTTTNGYTCTVGFTEGGSSRTWRIREDRRLWWERPMERRARRGEPDFNQR
jgi:hypothetical protein